MVLVPLPHSNSKQVMCYTSAYLWSGPSTSLQLQAGSVLHLCLPMVLVPLPHSNSKQAVCYTSAYLWFWSHYLTPTPSRQCVTPLLTYGSGPTTSLQLQAGSVLHLCLPMVLVPLPHSNSKQAVCYTSAYLWFWSHYLTPTPSRQCVKPLLTYGSGPTTSLQLQAGSVLNLCLPMVLVSHSNSKQAVCYTSAYLWFWSHYLTPTPSRQCVIPLLTYGSGPTTSLQLQAGSVLYLCLPMVLVPLPHSNSKQAVCYTSAYLWFWSHYLTPTPSRQCVTPLLTYGSGPTTSLQLQAGSVLHLCLPMVLVSPPHSNSKQAVCYTSAYLWFWSLHLTPTPSRRCVIPQLTYGSGPTTSLQLQAGGVLHLCLPMVLVPLPHSNSKQAVCYTSAYLWFWSHYLTPTPSRRCVIPLLTYGSGPTTSLQPQAGSVLNLCLPMVLVPLPHSNSKQAIC